MKHAEDTLERLLIDVTWLWTLSRMRVNPNPRKLLGHSAEIDLFVEEVGD